MLTHKYFENKFSSPSTEDEGDDIDYDYQEVRSFDRSSAGSIPWAEDAIKQNQQEWERIESYFNSEDDNYLPNEDKDLCREILEWRRFCSNTNNKGKTKEIKENQKTYASQKTQDSEIESDDETLIENSTTSTLKSSKIPLRNLISISKNQIDNRRNEKQSAKSVNFPVNSTYSNVKTLSKNFEKDLRISSVPRINKRTSIFQNNYSFPTTQNLQQQTIPVKIIQRHYPQPQLFPSQSAKYLLDKYPNAIVTIEKKISPHSATYSRIAPVYNLIKKTNTKTMPIFNQSHQYQPRYNIIRNTGSRNQKNQVILPSLSTIHSNGLTSTTNVQPNNLRSISAINHKHYENRQVRNISNLNQIEYMPSLSAFNKYKYHS